MAAFDGAMALGDPPAEALAIPFEGTHMPAYLVRAAGSDHGLRPLLICGGGYDSTMVENHLGFGIAAAARGYHVLLHDGPGQGRLLIEEGLPLRHDWERVISAVVDAAETIEGVDPSRIAYEAWSLGGYFAPRAAAFEHRLAAIVADPGQWDMLAQLRGMGRMMGMPDDRVARLPELDDEDAARITAIVAGNRGLEWKVMKRGFWTNGADGLAAWFAEMARWNVSECAGRIRCPTLVTAAEDDPVAAGAQTLYDALECPKELMRFTAADGAGTHCELLNRSLLNRRVLDWLDATLAA
jgi:alpha-beta hydrolase superfamily lysophospholipase